MPKPMAEALGWPDTPIGYSDLLALANDPEGWASKGHPEWGPFRLGKTNPNFSTSALSATIAQYYAATGKTDGLTLEDVNRPDVEQFNRGVESAVVHYGDITMTFLNNLFRSDRAGASLTYVSAVAVEEKSVIDYNAGNPDGVLDPGEEPRKPRVPLVAVYPKEGTLFSDNPLFVLDAPWVDATERAGGEAFAEFVREPENQEKVLEFGFRPGNPAVSVAAPITTENGVDPAQPQTTLGVPSPEVLVRIVDLWAEQRKSARVLIVLDVSGSMGEEAGPGGETKLDLAKQAAIDALAQFKSEDEVGLRIFSTNVQGREPTDYLDLVPVGPIGAQREALVTRIRSLIPREGTPLYTVTEASYEDMKASFAPERINAVVLLTDGRNEDPRNEDINGTLSLLRAGTEGQSSQPVRVFTIAFGEGADMASLGRIAEATNAAAYDASDPQTIDNVFIAVISNF
jgi:Ca-activated chloride channel family protein